MVVPAGEPDVAAVGAAVCELVSENRLSLSGWLKKLSDEEMVGKFKI